jgi:hypothetical protein
VRELGTRSIVVIAENLTREQVYKVELLPAPDTSYGLIPIPLLRNLPVFGQMQIRFAIAPTTLFAVMPL